MITITSPSALSGVNVLMKLVEAIRSNRGLPPTAPGAISVPALLAA